MKVLIITGEGLGKAILALRERFKESVDILSINYLDDLTTFYNQGYTFDKCIVLTPKRVIHDYSVEILETNLLDFKKNLEEHQTGSMQEIIFCVSTEEEGCIVAENTCDLAGMFYAIGVNSVSMGDLNSFVTMQGSTLAQRYKSYDLATLRSLEIRKQKDLKIGAFAEEAEPIKLDLDTEVQSGGFEDEGSLVGAISGLDDTSNTKGDNIYKKLDMADSFWGEGEDVQSTPEEIGNFPQPFRASHSEDTNEQDEEDEEDDFFTNPKAISGGGFFSEPTPPVQATHIEQNEEDRQDEQDSFFSSSSQGQGFDSLGAGFINTGFGSLTGETTEDEVTEDTGEDIGDFFSQSAGFFDTEPVPTEPVPTKPAPLPKQIQSEEIEEDEPEEVKPVLKKGLKRKNTQQEKKETEQVQVQADISDTVAEPKKKGLFGRKTKKQEAVMEEEEPKAVEPVVEKKGLGGKLKRKGEENRVAPKAGDLDITEEPNQVILEELDDTYTDDFEDIPVGTPASTTTDTQMVDTSMLFEETRTQVERGKGAGIQDKRAGNQKVSSRDKATKKTSIPKELQAKLNVYKKRGALMVFTGSPNTGKTVISGNIANLLCKLGYSVALVDLDTLYKGQSYLNADCCDMVHSSHTSRQSVVSALNSTGTDFSRYLDVVRPGLHMLTTTLGSDSMRPEALVTNKSFSRLIHELIASYNFVIVDVGFQDLKTVFRDFADSADSLVFVEEATTHGMTNFMLNLANIEDEAVQSLIFHRGSLVLNKEDGMNNFFGRRVNDTLTLLTAIDDLVYSLQGAEAELKFSDIRVAGVLQYNKSFEPFWNNKKFISDTAEGEKLFIGLLQNCL